MRQLAATLILLLLAGCGKESPVVAAADGEPFAKAYETADGKYMMTAAIEGKFYQALLEGLGLDPASVPDRRQPANWAALETTLAGAFRTRTRDEWTAVFAGRDACVSPVLDMGEAPSHPHLRARGAFGQFQGHPMPVTAPRLSATPAAPLDRPPLDASALLADWGLTASQADLLTGRG